MCDNEKFCRKWADVESCDYAFDVRRFDVYHIEFYDLHKWDGKRIHWNGYDVGVGYGETLEDAWIDMAAKILKHEHAMSKEEALVKAELRMSKELPRGWGQTEYSMHWQRCK